MRELINVPSLSDIYGQYQQHLVKCPAFHKRSCIFPSILMHFPEPTHAPISIHSIHTYISRLNIYAILYEKTLPTGSYIIF